MKNANNTNNAAANALDDQFADAEAHAEAFKELEVATRQTALAMIGFDCGLATLIDGACEAADMLSGSSIDQERDDRLKRVRALLQQAARIAGKL